MSTLEEKREQTKPIPIGVSLPKFLLAEIDEERKNWDYSRSKMIKRIVEFAISNPSLLRNFVQKQEELELSIIFGVREVLEKERSPKPKSYRRR